MSRKSHGAADFLMIFFLSNRFGLEGLVTFKRENEYDAETYEIAVPVDGTSSSNGGKSVRIGVFDKVLVEISVEKVRYIQGVVPAAFNYCRFRNANVFFSSTLVPRSQDKNTQRGRVTMALIEPVDSRGM